MESIGSGPNGSALFSQEPHVTVVHNPVRKTPYAALLPLHLYLSDGESVLRAPKKRQRMIHFRGHGCADINTPCQAQGVLGITVR